MIPKVFDKCPPISIIQSRQASRSRNIELKREDGDVGKFDTSNGQDIDPQLWTAIEQQQ